MPGAIPRTWIDAMFSQFAIQWGPRWTSTMTTDALIEQAKQHWQKQLQGMTGEQVKQAMDTVMARTDDRGESWPPNPAEFRAAGKPKAPPHAGMYQQLPKLPRPAPTPDEIEAGHQVLRACKAMARGVQTDA